MTNAHQESLKNLTSDHASRLNWLRAAVLGANDGIISMAGLVVGVAGATTSSSLIFTAGMAGIIAGTISMATGEYVSVSSSRDAEHALLKREREAHSKSPDKELIELTEIYEAKGLKRDTAEKVAKELSDYDAFAAHVDAEFRMDPHNLANPWHAALASAASFTMGAIIPLVAILIPPPGVRIPVAFFSVLVALVITGTFSAKVGNANVSRAVVRVLLGGVIAMAVTYGIGRLFGVSAA